MTAIHINLNLDKKCRGCLSEEGTMTAVFEDNLEGNISKMFESCTSLQINVDDGYPTKICNKCLARLSDSYQFRQMCLESDLAMRTLDLDLEKPPEEVLIKTDVVSDVGYSEAYNNYKEYNGKDEEDEIADKYNVTATVKAEDEKDNHEDALRNYYECETCSIKFETFRNLKEHEFELHMPGRMCGVCNQTFTTVDEVMNHSRKHLRKSGGRKYRCKECSKEYTSSHNLQIHMYSHKGYKPFTCKDCGKSFTKLNSLNSHLSLHTGCLSYLCSECGKGFSTSTGLKRHKIAHSGERPNKCKQCPASFAASGDLTVHMRSHTGEKPYLCPTCGKAFARVSHLNAHARIHTGEKPYKCSRCDKAFTQSGDQKSHERTHTGEKPYGCSVCKKRFIQSSGLASHMRTHTGEKMYRCTICLKAFAQGSSLSRHVRCHND